MAAPLPTFWSTSRTSSIVILIFSFLSKRLFPPNKRRASYPRFISRIRAMFGHWSNTSSVRVCWSISAMPPRRNNRSQHRNSILIITSPRSWKPTRRRSLRSRRNKTPGRCYRCRISPDKIWNWNSSNISNDSGNSVWILSKSISNRCSTKRSPIMHHIYVNVRRSLPSRKPFERKVWSSTRSTVWPSSRRNTTTTRPVKRNFSRRNWRSR